MMTIVYFDCFSGISGDMVIGALIDAGADPKQLEAELKKLAIEDEYELTWRKVVKNGITCTKFDVIVKNDSLSHTHDHHHNDGHSHGGSYHRDDRHSHDDGHHHVHGHTHGDGHHHAHGHRHNDGHHHHDHEHDHDDSHHHHDHHHRSYKEIAAMIEASELAAEVKETALAIFRRIGEAEGRIHHVPLDDVHFHEVGAVDSIIDIVGTAILIHQLGAVSIQSSPIPVGSGTVHIAHGEYPVPAPATLELLKGVPIEQSAVKGELTTPTGAAIVSVLAERFGPLPSMKLTAIGYGAGTKTFPHRPNVLRVVIGEQP